MEILVYAVPSWCLRAAGNQNEIEAYTDINGYHEISVAAHDDKGT